MNDSSITRREFIMHSFGFSFCFAAAAGSYRAIAAPPQTISKVRIALIADVHHDIMHDAPQRLAAFLKKADEWQADAVMEMGDFCTPKPSNRAFADQFEAFAGRKFHVIGNHETDGGFKREQVVAFHKMPGRYYSFDLGGLHGVVLDGNDVPPGHKGGYPSHINDEQIAWLRDDLAKTELPVFVFSHQSLEIPTCIKSQDKVRAVLEGAKRADGTRKVAACFNGHWHINHARVINEIPYIHINSASYFWMGGDYRHDSYEAEVHKAHPYIAYTAPYKEALFALLEIDFATQKFTLTGTQSQWVGPSPQDMKYKNEVLENTWLAPQCSPREGTL